MALTEFERSRIRYHLGFPNVGYTTVLGLGFPAAGQPAFLLEAAMSSLLPEGEPTVRYAVKQCDCIEAQLAEARTRMKAQTAGEVILRATEEIANLEEQYRYWTDALVDCFGVVKNPFSKKHQLIDGQVFVVHPS